MLSVLLAVDPLPWARSQMAFTLAVHIILVPLGVAWAFMALVANYRAIKYDDADALVLAQRWSKCMAVTFAVGAVTGTVLTFEFGLLWPKFMGRFGDAFGIPFVVEGLFFFLEAIFLAIYIYGWKRLKPWPHFWTGVPIVLAGIGGTVSVVAANAWMNEPAGFTLNSAGKVVDVDPLEVIFNKAMPLQSLHMLIAAYLVGGFLIASVYAWAMLRGRRDRYHRLGFLIAFSVAAVATPVQMLVGDELARWVYNNEPVKFAAIEMVPKTASDVPETLFGHLNSDNEVTGGIAIPGLASWLSDPATGTSTVIQGLDTVPEERAAHQPRGRRRPPRVGRHGGRGHHAHAARGVVLRQLRLPPPDAREQGVPARGGRGGSVVDPRARGGLGRHRGRSSTVDRAQLHEGRSGHDHELGGVDHVPRRGRGLRRRRGDARADPPQDECALARGRGGARGRALRTEARAAQGAGAVSRPA